MEPEPTTLLFALAEPRALASVVAGAPTLALALASTCRALHGSLAALPIEALLPANVVTSTDVANDAAQLALAPFGRSADGKSWGADFVALAIVVAQRQQMLVAIAARAEQADGSDEPLAADAAYDAERARLCGDLVVASRFFKRCEPRRQLATLFLPGHEALIGFAAGPMLRAAGSAHDGALAGAAARILVGASFDRLTTYKISAGFRVRQGRGIDPGWQPPPASAPLYALGWALLAGGEDAVEAARVVLSLATAERWLVAEVGLALVGCSCQGNPSGRGHLEQAEQTPLRRGLCAALASRSELLSCLGCAIILGILGMSEDPSVVARAGLALPLARAWRAGGEAAGAPDVPPRRRLSAALCGLALADLCRKLLPTPPEPTLKTRAAPKGWDKEAWDAVLATNHRSALSNRAAHLAARELLLSELAQAGVEVPTSLLAMEGGTRQQWPATAEFDGHGGPTAAPWPAELAALEEAWAAIPQQLRAHLKPADGPGEPDTFNSFMRLLGAVEGTFAAELQQLETSLDYTFGGACTCSMCAIAHDEDGY